MSDFTDAFINHLQAMALRDRGALAVLRRSLGFEPGTYPPAYPAVERFAAQGPDNDVRRQALYLSAGLFALHPLHGHGQSLTAALGQAMRRRESASIEKRFIALLAADADSLPNHLRQAVSLIAADGAAIDYAELLDDLGRLLQRWNEEQRDRVRQRWARAFYRAAEPPGGDTTAAEPVTPSTSAA
jgi:CRISPR system Cascade subunit CasB